MNCVVLLASQSVFHNLWTVIHLYLTRNITNRGNEIITEIWMVQTSLQKRRCDHRIGVALAVNLGLLI